MNRNKKGVMPEITREIYKGVKKFDRQQFANFCVDLYQYGYEDGKASVPTIDWSTIYAAIGRIKGIGTKKLEEIQRAIEGVVVGENKDNQKGKG